LFLAYPLAMLCLFGYLRPVHYHCTGQHLAGGLGDAQLVSECTLRSVFYRDGTVIIPHIFCDSNATSSNFKTCLFGGLADAIKQCNFLRGPPYV